ncbi:hypothetical protein [Nakamurella flava]|nr:hypothetical protein [Nakamurella flava]
MDMLIEHLVRDRMREVRTQMSGSRSERQMRQARRLARRSSNRRG